MLLRVDLVGQLVGRLRTVAATLLDLLQNCLLIELHKTPFRVVRHAAETGGFRTRGTT